MFLMKKCQLPLTNAFNILRTRIDRFGVVQPNITQLATKGRILIELPGQNDPARVRELLQGTANLEFWETYENSEIIGYLSQANNALREIRTSKRLTDTVKTLHSRQKLQLQILQKRISLFSILLEKILHRPQQQIPGKSLIFRIPCLGYLTHG